MATVHPSRMGLVPQDSRPPRQDLPRGRSPATPPPGSSRRSRSPTRRNDRGLDWEKDDRRERDRNRRDRARADDYFDERDGASRRERSRSLDRERDNEREGRRAQDRPRRPSPEYSEYRRPSPPQRDSTSSAPWRQQENMYPNRRDRAPHQGYGGADFSDSRRQQRESSTFSIWPPSPKAPTRPSQSPDGRHKHSKKRHRHETPVSSSGSEDDRRQRKSKKKHKKDKERNYRSRKSRSKSARYDTDSEDERRERRRQQRSRSRGRNESEERYRIKHQSSRTRSPEELPPPSADDEDEWVEMPTASMPLASMAPKQSNGVGTATSPPVPTAFTSAKTTTNTKPAALSAVQDEDSDEEVGPKPASKPTTSKKVDERQYGGALLRGEGSAMAAFLQDGTDVRIPRRGEIGLTSDEIASFESVGYVMSGSRHRRMNAVRMRKENQVISAEEKRGILKLQKEERERREAILREEFQELVNEKLKAQGPTK